MQWAKVKTILLVILAAVDLFLICNLFAQWLEGKAQQRALQNDIAVVLQDSGVQCADTLRIPSGCSAIALEVERDRAAEEAAARAVLNDPAREETADGVVQFASANGEMVWHADGGIHARFTPNEDKMLPHSTSEYGIKRAARALFEKCGVSMRGGSITVDVAGRKATLAATVAGRPVFGRALTVTFREDGDIMLEGRWSFSTPYALASDSARSFEAGDALLQFVRGQQGLSEIREIQFGYQMLLGVSGRLQMSPAWRIETDQGKFLVDALKKTVIVQANIVQETVN